ncbi:MAG: hypothetical protein ABJE95_08595 [Byssovorax sp.]
MALLILSTLDVLPHARKGTHRNTDISREAVIGLLITIGALGGARQMLRHIRRDSARWSGAVRMLREELGVTRISPPAWIDSLWAGPIPRDISRWGRYTRYVDCSVSGYPVLIVAKAASVTLLLAAWTPGVSDEPDEQMISPTWRDIPGVSGLMDALSASDFDVVVTPAGLIGSVCENSMSNFRQHPEQLVGLAPAVRRIADLAIAIHAEPVDTAWFGSDEPGPSAPSDRGES